MRYIIQVAFIRESMRKREVAWHNMDYSTLTLWGARRVRNRLRYTKWDHHLDDKPAYRIYDTQTKKVVS